VRRSPDPAARAEPGAEADELTAELTASYWRAHDQRLAETGFFAIARQLPGLIGQAIRLGWEANRRDTGRDDRAEPGLRNPHRIRTAGYQ
jgi:ATP-binding cassette subfamily B protein/ATP-binding cassette subfamily C protein